MPRLLLLMTTTTYRASAFMAAARRLQVTVVVGSDQPQALEALTPGSTRLCAESLLQVVGDKVRVRAIRSLALSQALGRERHRIHVQEHVQTCCGVGDPPAPECERTSLGFPVVEVRAPLP